MSERLSTALSAGSEVEAPGALFEMRVYESRPGRRNELVALFEDAFRPLYESVGARIVASFVDLDDPQRWVWIRAFPDVDARGAALRAFYTHPEWLKRRAAANALIARSSDARLLRPIAWIPGGVEASPVVGCTRFTGLGRERHPDAPSRADAAHPLGAAILAHLVTASVANSYPRQRLRREPTRVVLSAIMSDCTARPVDAKFVDGSSVQRWRLESTRRFRSPQTGDPT